MNLHAIKDARLYGHIPLLTERHVERWDDEANERSGYLIDMWEENGRVLGLWEHRNTDKQYIIFLPDYNLANADQRKWFNEDQRDLEQRRANHQDMWHWIISVEYVTTHR